MHAASRPEKAKQPHLGREWRSVTAYLKAGLYPQLSAPWSRLGMPPSQPREASAERCSLERVAGQEVKTEPHFSASRTVELKEDVLVHRITQNSFVWLCKFETFK